ncbi:MAG: hypothetical protein MI746_12355 [Pseudomonadales bacterium]|nr:hypothetical protein [Pseudomonadales bacterium]
MRNCHSLKLALLFLVAFILGSKGNAQGLVPEGDFYKIPENASLVLPGSNWVCNWGYARVGFSCERILLPENARYRIDGNAWICLTGYVHEGDECLKVVVPQNARLDHAGKGWICLDGYRRFGIACIEDSSSTPQDEIDV